ncbi:MAG TPA: cytidylate kinase-like family protein [Bacteroidales bacterium]|nr:cytidylate kinase-like family protein [Bacteroidales bacterium]
MTDTFLQYMYKNPQKNKKSINTGGAVITIAREYGCYSTEIGDLLVKKINENQAKTWECVSSQVLEKVARNLKVPISEIVHIFGANEKGVVANFFSSFLVTNNNISDSKIIQNIINVMIDYTKQGNCVIVGRAGVIFSKYNQNALNIRLVAPLEWRVEQICKRFNINSDVALNQIEEIDKKRALFMTYFDAYKRDSELFDIILNRAFLSNEEIVDTIYYLAMKKSII